MFEKATQVRKFAKVLLIGPYKGGKTMGALSFPKPCVLDTERGSLLHADRFDFGVVEGNSLEKIAEILDYLEGHPDEFKTFVIDSATIPWDRLTEEQSRKSRGDNMTFADWGAVKRKWKSFANRLLDLQMNVVMVAREKEEYETVIDPVTGKDVLRKTGRKLGDIEKGTPYFVDFIIRMETRMTTKKSKTKRASNNIEYVAVVEGSRRPELPNGKEYNITGKSLYTELFAPMEKILQGGKKLPAREKRQEVPEPVSELTTPEKLSAITEKFSGNDFDGMSVDDLKVLMSRATQMRWPDGKKFTSKQGKALIKFLYGVDSAYSLKKEEANELYVSFGEVLAGRSFLTILPGGDNIPVIAHPVEKAGEKKGV